MTLHQIHQLLPTPCTKQIQIVTRDDDRVQMVIQAIEVNNWSNATTSDYMKMSEELSVHQGIILRGLRKVMSTCLQRRRITNLAHFFIKESLKPNAYFG